MFFFRLETNPLVIGAAGVMVTHLAGVLQGMP